MPNSRTVTGKKNYYQILMVTPKASQEEIKMAFRRLARRYHPDVNPNNKLAEEKFKEINEAYDILADGNKRQQYDFEYLGVSKRPFNSNKSNHGRRKNDFVNFGNFSNFVENLKQNNSPNNSTRFRSDKTEAYAQTTTKRVKTINPRALPRDIEAKLSLPLQKAYLGGRERIRLEDGRSLEVEMPSCMYDGQKN